MSETPFNRGTIQQCYAETLCQGGERYPNKTTKKHLAVEKQHELTLLLA